MQLLPSPRAPPRWKEAGGWGWGWGGKGGKIKRLSSIWRRKKTQIQTVTEVKEKFSDYKKINEGLYSIMRDGFSTEVIIVFLEDRL